MQLNFSLLNHDRAIVHASTFRCWAPRLFTRRISAAFEFCIRAAFCFAAIRSARGAVMMS